MYTLYGYNTEIETSYCIFTTGKFDPSCDSRFFAIGKFDDVSELINIMQNDDDLRELTPRQVRAYARDLMRTIDVLPNYQ